MAAMPYTFSLENVFRSACIPAPPLGSEPAIVRTVWIMTEPIIMNTMFRLVTILLLAAVGASAQVPAGAPFDPKIHPNPIVTWVRDQDFKTTPFAEAVKQAGIEIMSLSQDEGKRDSLQLAM